MFRILLVDDEKNERTGIRFLIDKFHLPLAVAEAPNGRAALEYIRAHPVDILFTDVKMPHMDGLELAKAVRQHDESIRIIIFSAFGEFEYARKAMAAKAVSYLLKPIDVIEFERTIRDVIDQCEQRRQAEKAARQRHRLDEAQALFQLLSGVGGGPVAEMPDPLPAGVAGGGWNTLINIETRNSLFLEQKEAFLRLADSGSPCRYTYVDLYPNAAYLVLQCSSKPSEERLEAFAERLRRDVTEVLREGISILIGPSFSDVAELPRQAARLNRLRGNIFEGDQGVLFAERLDAADGYYAQGIEESREKVLAAIEAGELDEAALQLQRLAKALEGSGALSLVYLHHILYDLISRLYQSQGIGDKTLVNTRIEEAVHEAVRGGLGPKFQAMVAEAAQTGTGDDGDGVAQKVMQIIEAEYAGDIGLDYIAGKVNLSPAYLSFLFKKETGSNIIRQLADHRMKKARELLAGSNLKIVEIAQRCGYDNPSYFNRLFKNMNGMTPGQYREAKP